MEFIEMWTNWLGRFIWDEDIVQVRPLSSRLLKSYFLNGIVNQIKQIHQFGESCTKAWRCCFASSVWTVRYRYSPQIWALRLAGFKASLLQSEDHPFDSDSAYKEDKTYSNLKDDISYYTHAAVAQRPERHIANVKVEISKFFCCSNSVSLIIEVNPSEGRLCTEKYGYEIPYWIYFIVIWCKGSTTVFGAVCIGSNPLMTTYNWRNSLIA